MKKRLVAVTLGVILSLSTVGEAGAAAFSSSDSEVVVQDETTESESTDETETSTDEPEAEDLFSAGENGDTNTDDVEFQSTGDNSSEFSAGDETETPVSVPADETDDSDSVSVKAEDWIMEEGHFKLHKSVKESSTDISDEDPVQTDDITQVDSQDSEVVSADSDIEDGNTSDSNISDNDAADTVDESESYYTAADGLLKISTEYKGEIHTGWYLFDENGYMVIGQAEVTVEQEKDNVAAQAADNEETADAGEVQQSCFTSEAEAEVYEGCEGEAVTPYSSTVGQQIRNKWNWTGTVWQYYNAEGTLRTVAQLEAEQKANGTYTGYFKIGNDYYCLDANGKPRTGNITLTVKGVSNLYYFEKDSNIPGRMFHEGWRCIGLGTSKERWLYYNQGGSNPADIGKYYKRGITATRLDENIKGDKTYLIDRKGYLLKSTVKKAANGAYYGTDAAGRIYTSTLVKYGKYRYYFGANGKRATWSRRWKKVGTHYYYFGNVPGRVAEKHGWQKLTNTKGQFLGWLYFDANGNHYTSKWTSEGYYFRSNGKLASGILEINNKKYLFEVSSSTVHKGKVYKGTLVYYKNKWYMASSSGALYQNGWRKHNKAWYYLKDYRIQTNCFMKKNGVNGYLDASGKYKTGWVLVSNAKNLMRYIDPDGNGYAKNTSKWINGVLYYFDKNGYRITDVSSKYPTGPYYLEVQRLNGVMTVYTDRTKKIPIKTIRVSVGVPSTPTPTGEYTLRSSARWQMLMGPSWGQYGTHVEGAGQGGIFVHSVACAQANSFNLPAVEYNKLGQPASHGCIRACVADAKWVYYHCNGSRINIIDGVIQYNDALKGPLGKNPLTPLRGAKNFDPTDPEV